MFVRDLKGGIMKVIFEFDTDSENFDKFQLQSHYQAEKMTLCLLELENGINTIAEAKFLPAR